MENIPNAVVKRLPMYYRHLGELKESEVERISSGELSERMNVTASQIRQDLNHFGGFGQQGYGYNVEYLHTIIGNILGLDKKYHVIIVGAGNLGRALANYTNFEKSGFVITGIFDINLDLKGEIIRNVPVSHIDEMETFLKKNKIDIAALTVPKSAAAGLADRLVKLGVKAFWNFAHVDLKVPEHVIVESVHLSDSLMRLSYSLSNLEK
ncbi:MAG: redox-sensing transcriptional repressor Rex [Lachnospiraceae bacterium]|jgi:AT-rich DNA-binding protein|nr:redox-sensing transcriptional repressor Rex [Lachnospiraceae bacterium]MCI8826567.1 redox-sensing transcriptional repressor Rex [Lachnospiraceae bacterium]MCI9371622.1 redox-sensing transcriptional repressor Rex [Lachnospiraceae bacterium]